MLPHFHLPSLAYRVLRRGAASASDFCCDLRYRVRTGGFVHSPFHYLGAVRTESVPYATLRHIFRRLTIGPEDVLVDVGCGKGRVLHWWQSSFPNPVIGLELNPAVAAVARANCPGSRILVGDAADLLPADGTLLFLFNPFHGEFMHRFARRLKVVCRPGTRLVYVRASCLDVFQEDPAFTCEPLAAGWLSPGPTYLIRLVSSSPPA